MVIESKMVKKKYYYAVYFYVGKDKKNGRCFAQGVKSVEHDKPYFSNVRFFKIDLERELKKIFKKTDFTIKHSHSRRIKATEFESFKDELEIYEPFLQHYKDGLL